VCSIYYVKIVNRVESIVYDPKGISLYFFYFFNHYFRIVNATHNIIIIIMLTFLELFCSTKTFHYRRCHIFLSDSNEQTLKTLQVENTLVKLR